MAAVFFTNLFAIFLAAAFLPTGFFAVPGFGVAAAFAALTAAHRFRAAAAMARLPEALNLRFRFAGSGEAALSVLSPFSVWRSSAI